jgi:hypothetical protein
LDLLKAPQRGAFGGESQPRFTAFHSHWFGTDVTLVFRQNSDLLWFQQLAPSHEVFKVWYKSEPCSACCGSSWVWFTAVFVRAKIFC